MIKNMTEGSPSKILWQFSIPMLISVAFQQIYNIVDSIVAGKFVGPDALAAVGASYPITMIFMAFAIGSNIGCSVVISQLFGGRQLAKMKSAIWTSLLAILVISTLLTLIGLVLCNPLMEMINTPANIFNDSTLYLRIYIAGLIFIFLYNICTGVFTALGDSITPLIFLIISSLGNIVLDLVFVIDFHMGVAGVAWATFLMQGVASLLAFITLMIRMVKIKTEEYKKFSFEMLKRISLIAIPSILQQSFISVGNLFIQGVVNGYGSTVIAGYSAAIKLNTFAITSFTTLGNSLSSFTAQNIGAGKLDRVMKGFRAGLAIAMSVVIPFIIAFSGFGSIMMELFVKQKSEDVIQVGVTFLRIVSPFYLVISIKLMADGVIRGSGAMRYFMISTFSDLILRVILSYILSAQFASTGIWMSWPIGWVIATILSCYFLFAGKWKKFID
jgi:putative MATE family efflux protein